MDRKIIAAITFVIVAVLFIFFAPVIPRITAGPLLNGGPHYHDLISINSQFFHVGTSYWNGHYFFHPDPFCGDI